MMDESVLPYVPWRENSNGDLQEVRITEPWTKYYPGGVWSDLIDCQWKVHTLVHTLDPPCNLSSDLSRGSLNMMV
jgi:hypothetical protein